MSEYRCVVCPKTCASAEEGIASIIIETRARKETLDTEQVRINVRAAALNFPDLLMMQNKYQYKPTFPHVLCSEGTGVVREVGSKVTHFKVGDRVIFNLGTHGAASEEVLIHQSLVKPLPDHFTFSEGAGYEMAFMTGYHALVQRGRLRAGEWLLVTGAAGGVGLAAVQLGKALGARVIAAAGSDEKLEVCKKVGADAVINYSNKSLKDEVSKITSGHFCDVIYEPVGGGIFDQCVRCVTPAGGARLLVIGFAGGTIPQLPANLALIKGFDLVGVRMGAQFHVQPELRTQASLELWWLLCGNPDLRPHVGAEFPPERAKEAFALLNERKITGKCCIVFDRDSKL